MSSITSRNQTRNQAIFDYDFSKLFLFGNVFRKVNIAASGADLNLKAGMLIGAVDGVYQIFKSGTSNISFVGVLADEDFTITNGSNADVTICMGGRVNSALLVFDGTDVLTTVISHRTLLERIESDSLGIEVVVSDQLSKFDN
jgi:hypothetical protein